MSKNKTCAHKYKIGNNVYCKIRVGDCGFCSNSVSKCKYAERIPPQSNRAYHSFSENEMVHKSGRSF